jgi:hypothetical protein
VDIAKVKHVVDTARLKNVAPLAKATQRGGQSDKLAREREREKERKREMRRERERKGEDETKLAAQERKRAGSQKEEVKDAGSVYEVEVGQTLQTRGTQFKAPSSPSLSCHTALHAGLSGERRVEESTAAASRAAAAAGAPAAAPLAAVADSALSMHMRTSARADARRLCLYDGIWCKVK